MYTESEIKAMTVAKLKELCIKYEIGVEKTKKDLVSKITEFFVKTNAMKQEESTIWSSKYMRWEVFKLHTTKSGKEKSNL